MKKSDIAMIVLIAGVSVIISFLIVGQLSFLKIQDKETKVRTVESISTSVTDPDTAVFNANSINPTVKTVIGGGE